MPPEVLPPSRAEGAEPLQRWAAEGLPVPPSWAIPAELVRDSAPEQLASVLASLTSSLEGAGEGGYWLMRQGRMNEQSLRESLINLDSHAALASALKQWFAAPDAPARAVIQALPGRQAAGVLFTRHPVRQDLDHVVVEAVTEGGQAGQERLILHSDGRVAFQSEDQSPLLANIGPHPFSALAAQLKTGFERPQACEWVYDGGRLWVVQCLPVGSLPSPQEAWTRRQDFQLWNQAVSPLWYTLAGRWFKTGFWRPLGERLGWRELGNVEPYRRQHSHIYGNSQFFRALLGEQDVPGLRDALPPAWRPREQAGTLSTRRLDGLRRWLTPWRLALLARRHARLAERELASLDDNGLWQQLMQYDRIGERLAGNEGWLAYIALPRWLAGAGELPLPLVALLSPGEKRALLAFAEGQGARQALGPMAMGADPVFARLREVPPELSLLEQIAPARRQRLAEVLRQPAAVPSVLRQRQFARGLRQQLGDSLREVLNRMAGIMMMRGQLTRPDDICFLYFDELWQLWHQAGQPAGAAPAKLGERKMRYLTSAYQGAPDWMLDQVAYGVRLNQRAHPVLNGVGLVAGQASGAVRRIYSGWNLAKVEAGDILVLDQCETGWLPWLCLADGIILTGRDPLNPAAALARALGIPTVAGVDDAMHCLVDGNQVSIDGSSGKVEELDA